MDQCDAIEKSYSIRAEDSALSTAFDTALFDGRDFFRRLLLPGLGAAAAAGAWLGAEAGGPTAPCTQPIRVAQHAAVGMAAEAV